MHISRVWFVFYCNLRTTVKLSETAHFQNKPSTEDIDTELGEANFTFLRSFSSKTNLVPQMFLNNTDSTQRRSKKCILQKKHLYFVVQS